MDQVGVREFDGGLVGEFRRDKRGWRSSSHRTARRPICEVTRGTTVDLEGLTEEEATLAEILEILTLQWETWRGECRAEINLRER